MHEQSQPQSIDKSIGFAVEGNRNDSKAESIDDYIVPNDKIDDVLDYYKKLRKKHLHIKQERLVKKVAKYFHLKKKEAISYASRCCGRCDGVNDICVADTECDLHKIEGCEECFGPRLNKIANN